MPVSLLDLLKPLPSHPVPPQVPSPHSLAQLLATLVPPPSAPQPLHEQDLSRAKLQQLEDQLRKRTRGPGEDAFVSAPNSVAQLRDATERLRQLPGVRQVTDLMGMAPPDKEPQARLMGLPGNPLIPISQMWQADPVAVLGTPEMKAEKAAAEALRLNNLIRTAPTELSRGRLIVSPPVPWEVGTTFEPGQGMLFAGIEDAAADPDLMQKYAAGIADAPILRASEIARRGAVPAFVDRAAENVARLVEVYPRKWGQRAEMWYEGAHNIGNDIRATEINPRHNVTPDQVSALIATQSPSKEWPMNIDLAKRLARHWSEFRDSDAPFRRDLFDQYVKTTTASTEAKIIDKKMTADQAAKARAVLAAKIADAKAHVGKAWSDLPRLQQAQMIRAYSEIIDKEQRFPIYGPEGTITHPFATNKDKSYQKLVWQSYDNLMNGLLALEHPDNISEALGWGLKVRSFFNNINAPWDPRSVTVDTHNVGSAQIRPMGREHPAVGQVMRGPASASTGISGTHPLYRDAVTAATSGGRVPHQTQSVSWEAIKGLFSPEQRKNRTLVAAVDQVWKDYQRGKLRLGAVYERIQELAGGFDPPEWDK